MNPDPAKPQAHDACPAVTDPAAFRHYFQREGFILIRQALPGAACSEAVDGFLKEVHLDNRALFLRQAPSRYERHVYTDGGHMLHPIINLQDLPAWRYPQFRAASLALLAAPVLQRALHTLLGEPALLLHTAYSDAGQAPWPQREGPGPMIGAMVAAEDGASGADDGVILARHDLPPAAPQLHQGDLLLWNAPSACFIPPAAHQAGQRRLFTGHYTGRSYSPPHHAGAVLGGMKMLHYVNQRSPAGRAACYLRAERPGLYTLLARLVS